MRFQNGQIFDLAILKPDFELARPFQSQGMFQNGQVNNFEMARVSKRPGTTLSYSIGIVCYFDHTKIIIPKPQYQSFIVTSLACMTSQGFEVAGRGRKWG